VGRHNNTEPRRDGSGRVITRRSEAVQRIASGKGNVNRVQAQEANALHNADDKFQEERHIHKD
jgi:hypothetical protein